MAGDLWASNMGAPWAKMAYQPQTYIPRPDRKISEKLRMHLASVTEQLEHIASART
jgi:hypothetical protein